VIGDHLVVTVDRVQRCPFLLASPLFSQPDQDLHDSPEAGDACRSAGPYGGDSIVSRLSAAVTLCVEVAEAAKHVVADATGYVATT
jgi:hypothetical protein